MNRERDRRVYGRACRFCAKRKIKCNGESPCDSCEKRGRGSSCTSNNHVDELPATSTPGGHVDELPPASTRRYVPASTSGSSVSASARAGSAERSSLLAGRNEEEHSPSQLGVNSIPSFVDSATHIAHLQEMRPALGLQNASRQYPFLSTADDAQRRPPRIPFSHSQILKYWQAYEGTLSKLFPFVPRHSDLDALIVRALELSASREVGMHLPTDVAPEAMDPGSTSLLCAVLACGAQMSDDSPGQRERMSRDLAQHAFDFARLANWLLRPEHKTLQAMLLLSFFLQNDGQADGAWSLLGTVARLVISIGPGEMPAANVASLRVDSRNDLWMMVRCQDCVVSMCFDRPPMAYPQDAGYGGPAGSFASDGAHEFYMKALIKLGNQWLAEPEGVRKREATICSYVDRLDTLEVREDESGGTMSQRQNRQALVEQTTAKLLAGYLRGVVCRPALCTTNVLTGSPFHDKILRNAISSTERTMSAFVALGQLTKLPLRTWWMIHAGLSAAIMVEFVEVASGSPRLRHTQQAFLALLSRESRAPVSEGCSERPSWLSTSHSNYLRALQDYLRDRGVGNTGNDSHGRTDIRPHDTERVQDTVDQE